MMLAKEIGGVANTSWLQFLQTLTDVELKGKPESSAEQQTAPPSDSAAEKRTAPPSDSAAEGKPDGLDSQGSKRLKLLE